MGTAYSSPMVPAPRCPMCPSSSEHFGQPGGQRPGCGFPVAHLLALFHVGTGMLMEVLTGPLCTHDMSGVPQIHPKIRKDDVLLGDRGFCSFAHLALLVAGAVRTASSGSISVRSSTSALNGFMPDRDRREGQRAPSFAVAAEFRPDRPGGCLAQAGTAPRLDDGRAVCGAAGGVDRA